MTDRLDLVMQMNPDFAEAYANGESWALKHADMVRGIDGESNRRHPERAIKEDGKPHNWCGVCPHEKGCICCDLDHPTGDDYTEIKPFIGKLKGGF